MTQATENKQEISLCRPCTITDDKPARPGLNSPIQRAEGGGGFVTLNTPPTRSLRSHSARCETRIGGWWDLARMGSGGQGRMGVGGC